MKIITLLLNLFIFGIGIFIIITKEFDEDLFQYIIMLSLIITPILNIYIIFFKNLKGYIDSFFERKRYEELKKISDLKESLKEEKII